MTQALTREAILAAAATKDVPKERLDVPELGGFIWIRGMTGQQRDEYERDNMMQRKGRVQVDMEKLGNARARLAVRCICNDKGERLLQDGDAFILGGLRADVLSRIYAIAQRLSNVTDEDIDELKKHSETAGVGSASPTS